MKLKELAVSYRQSAQRLAQRIAQLRQERAQTDNPEQRRQLQVRIDTLLTMYRETRDIAVVCEQYYERGYCRNGKYKI